jgi:hypothetical protein
MSERRTGLEPIFVKGVAWEKTVSFERAMPDGGIVTRQLPLVYLGFEHDGCVHAIGTLLN